MNLNDIPDINKPSIDMNIETLESTLCKIWKLQFYEDAIEIKKIIESFYCSWKDKDLSVSGKDTINIKPNSANKYSVYSWSVLKNSKTLDYKVLDLWCWNWRYELLLNDIFQNLLKGCGDGWVLSPVWFADNCAKERGNFDWKIFSYTWVDNQIFKPQYSSDFVLSSIDDFLINYKAKFDNNSGDSGHDLLTKKWYDLIILSWMFENNWEFNIDNLKSLIWLLRTDWKIYMNFWNYWSNLEYRSKDSSLVELYIKDNIAWVLNETWLKYEINLYEKQKNKGFNIVVILNV